MTVELMDMDVPYTIGTNVNDDGVDFVEITVGQHTNEQQICLTEYEIDELILTLQFMKKVLKSYKK